MELSQRGPLDWGEQTEDLEGWAAGDEGGRGAWGEGVASLPATQVWRPRTEDALPGTARGST